MSCECGAGRGSGSPAVVASPPTPDSRRGWATRPDAGSSTCAAGARGAHQGPAPLARGERERQWRRYAARGASPACAGRTRRSPVTGCTWWGQPRLRGENRRFYPEVAVRSGPAPLARGELTRVPCLPIGGWASPACAGRTRRQSQGPPDLRGQPRLRGENGPKVDLDTRKRGPAPLARGERPALGCTRAGPRASPACAGRTTSTGPSTSTTRGQPRLRGRTPASRHSASAIRGQPRLRGENRLVLDGIKWEVGPAPLARGERGFGLRGERALGASPACAGRTPRTAPRASPPTGQPRLRGENGPLVARQQVHHGPAPLARGERPAPHVLDALVRASPACAGRTGGTRGTGSATSGQPRLRGENGTDAPVM